ncbi:MULTISPECIES: hypothetical protein [Saliphagus]|uniref:Small CPxCG-related zinc finger protein n=1 Tax=Saliphagus infecundisoli TaxID=1849069 RepID=A0ABD5QJ13_9EURY|nr:MULTISPECIES: hypothetical protein [Saliphagus]
MASESTASESRCLNCGFEAPGGDEQWVRLDLAGIGRLTQCPDCESTNVITGR